AIYAMLACARVGAIHSVVFAGFSSESLSGRINDCRSNFIITADTGRRGGKVIPLKYNVDQALISCPTIKKCFVVAHSHDKINWVKNRDFWVHEEIQKLGQINYKVDAKAEEMNAEDPLFILYTSGSTGKPKGVLHTTGGYLVYTAITFRYVFDYHDNDIYWCTADIGWITGHSYMVYGPLANGASIVLYEGVPHYPTWSRFWEIIDRYKVAIFYTAPTALRALMRESEDYLKTSSRQSLKIIGSVGEPINPDVWLWYRQKIAYNQCPVVDTWWQTETGGILITPLPGATALKPGSATRPFFGIKPVLVDDQGNVIDGIGEGNLCIEGSWPGQMRTVYQDHQRFVDTYFSKFRNKYFTGDGAKRDHDGYYWITGRVDDVINVSGHRLGTAEIESALIAHPHIAEAAVVGCTHPIKGQGIYAFVTVKSDYQPSDQLMQELKETVKKIIGAIAIPDFIQWASSLPKTRSGKIMRRILRKIAINQIADLGDISTLAEPSVVDDLISKRLIQN
ncbi:MAG: acetate--CoA ligase, partial [Alphaproteobacteria bacterium]|nr:acetate--CoA ligase [Alphaproteobacteria bacterium]